MNVNIKYLKDENGNTISPVCNTDSVYKGGTQLSSLLNTVYKVKTLYSGRTNSVATLSENGTNYNLLLLDFNSYNEYTTYHTNIIVPRNNAKYDAVIATVIQGTNVCQYYTVHYTLSNNKITFNHATYANVYHNSGSFIGADSTNNGLMYLSQVIGLKI